MLDNNTLSIKVSRDDCIANAKRYLEDGDIISSTIFIRKALEYDRFDFEAVCLLSELYGEIGASEYAIPELAALLPRALPRSQRTKICFLLADHCRLLDNINAMGYYLDMMERSQRTDMSDYYASLRAMDANTVTKRRGTQLALLMTLDEYREGISDISADDLVSVFGLTNVPEFVDTDNLIDPDLEFDETFAQSLAEQINEIEQLQGRAGGAKKSGAAEFRLVYPRPREYYLKKLEEARGAIENRKLRDAHACADEVLRDCPSLLPDALHTKLCAYMSAQDYRAVIDLAKKYEGTPIANSIRFQSAVCAAYILSGEKEKGYAMFDALADSPTEDNEEIRALVPLLSNFEAHTALAKFCKKALEREPYDVYFMTTLSQAMYNLGFKDKAVLLMKEIDLLFGEHCNADAYLSEYENGKSGMAYCPTLPFETMFRYGDKLDALRKLNARDYIDEFFADPALVRYGKWMIEQLPEDFGFSIVYSLFLENDDRVPLFMRDICLDGQLTSSILVQILIQMLAHGCEIDMPVLCEDKYVELSLKGLSKDKPMPLLFANALALVVYLISFKRFDLLDPCSSRPMIRLESLVNHQMSEDTYKEMKALSKKLRSPQCLAALYLEHILPSDTEWTHEKILKVLDVNEKLYEKYLRLLSPLFLFY